MAQRKHLDEFCVVDLLDDWNVDIPNWNYPRNLNHPECHSRLWKRFQDDGNVGRCYSTGHPEFQCRMRTGIWQVYCRKEAGAGAQNQTCLVISLQLPVRQFSRQTIGRA
ncbi:uncharacterized protein TNCV_858291 [Trichonephila clavipes]|nr:uncharacterized protein TNCV_858291 [Trichonephila clavipes]